MSMPRRSTSRWLPSAHPLARFALATLGPLAAAVLFTALAHAGQVRVDVTGVNTFVPSGVTVNAGDQVVWVWTGGTHTVTSGDTLSCAPDGLFSSGSQGGAGKSFSWKTPAGNGNLPYYCLPHCFGGMWGSIFWTTTPRAVSDFRIDEVRFTIDHLNDFVEIVNAGAASGDLGRYRLSVTGAAPVELPLNNIVVAPGGRVVIRLGVSGTNTPTTLYFPAVTLPRTGSAALYVPMSVAAQAVLTRADLLIDYVQWGAGAQQNEATAVTAGRWAAGEFVPAVADGHSIAFCGTPGQVGAAAWSGIEVPNAGTGDCSTPAARATWGRVRVTYR